MTLADLKTTLERLSYKDWEFVFNELGADHFYIQVRFLAKDNDKPDEMAMQSGRKWLISKHMTESEVVLTALKAVLTAEEHEAREQFKYYGLRVFDPHTNVRALWRLMEQDPVPTEHRGDSPEPSPMA